VAEERKTTIKQLAVDELAAFAGQLSLVIHSGLPVLDGLEIMRDDADNSEEAAILDMMLAAYRETDSLSQAMAAAGVFPPYMIGMVHTGEVTGNLDRIMARLEHHYQREGSLRTSVAQAVVYPVILSVMVTAVILILVMQVMPMFDQVFKELGTQMTGLPLVLARSAPPSAARVWCWSSSCWFWRCSCWPRPKKTAARIGFRPWGVGCRG
jgi:type IV pilus assembly protein PilC